MRFQFDKEKSREVQRKHGIGLQEAMEIFDQAYLVDQKSDDEIAAIKSLLARALAEERAIGSRKKKAG